MKEKQKNYVINFSWLGKKNPEDQQYYIHNAKTSKELETNFLSVIGKHAIANKTADVYVWYDSVRNSDEAIENTKKELSYYMERNDCDNIYLRDIREIPFVKMNEHLFNQQVSLYFIIDTLKGLVIPLHCFKEGKEIVIFNDLSVGGLNPNFVMCEDQYFDQKSIQQLNEYGAILNKNSSGSSFNGEKPEYIVENQHIQLVNNTYTSKILEYLVDVTAIRATNIFNMSEDKQKALTPIMFYIPYYAIAYEFHNLFNNLKQGNIKIRADVIECGTAQEWLTYEPEQHGIKFLGTHMNPSSSKQQVQYDVEINDNVIYRDEIVKNMDKHPDIEQVTREAYTRPGNPHSEPAISFPKQEHKNYSYKSWSHCAGEYYEKQNQHLADISSSENINHDLTNVELTAIGSSNTDVCDDWY